MLKEIYANRLKQTLQDVKNNPKHWNQEKWHCGTSHCFAGFAEVRLLCEMEKLELKAYLKKEDFNNNDISDEINPGYFGITEDSWATLTNSENRLEQLEFVVQNLIENDGNIVIRENPEICLEGMKLRGANLERANLSFANLERANLERANLSFANLEGANLEDAFLELAELENVNFKRANLQAANLEDANLKGANLKYANLESAYLKDANLEGADLEGANLKYADLIRTNLIGIDLSSVTLNESNLKRAILKGAIVAKGEN